MKKIILATVLAISLFAIWIVITVNLFFFDIILFILSLAFFILFGVYISILLVALARNKVKEKLLDKFLEEIKHKERKD